MHYVLCTIWYLVSTSLAGGCQQGPQQQVLQQQDPHARLFSYLDDTYLVVRADLGVLALAGLNRVLAPLGLELNTRKTQVWSPAGAQAVEPELAGHVVPVLPALGTKLRAPGDADDAALTLGGEGCGLDQATTRLQQIFARLQELRESLSKQARAALLTTYAGNASQHNLQLALATDD